MAKSKNRKKVGQRQNVDRKFAIKKINKLADDFQQKAMKNAVNTAIQIAIMFPSIIIEENYNLFMKKEVDGKGRGTRMALACLDLLYKLEKGDVTQEELEKKFEEVTKISFEELKKIGEMNIERK